MDDVERIRGLNDELRTRTKERDDAWRRIAELERTVRVLGRSVTGTVGPHLPVTATQLAEAMNVWLTVDEEARSA